MFETSPGNSIFLLSIPGTSTKLELLATGFAKVCLLTLPTWPHMYFLFVGTDICSPASFSANLTINHLAAY